MMTATARTVAAEPGKDSGRHLIITIHGIRTFGEWQTRLAALVREKEPRIVVEHYRYGYFSAIAFLVPWLRRRAVRRFREVLLSAVDSNLWDRIDIVSHSFGTYIVGNCLLAAAPSLRSLVNTVIFSGSVLKKHFQFTRYFQKMPAFVL